MSLFNGLFFRGLKIRMVLGAYSDCVDDDAGSWISEEASACLQGDGVILLEDLVFATVSHSHYWKN